MKILLSGSHGLMGNALLARWTVDGHSVARLVRRASAQRARTPDDVLWDPASNAVDADKLEGFDAVVHLAGESIATGRWTAAKKKRILESRVDGTGALAGAVARLKRPPAAFLCASAVGYYGDRGGETLTEASAPGRLFLSDVCRRWEEACAPAATCGARVANLRFGVILSAQGGALKAMLTPFKLGLGGVVGSGAQFMSYIALDDALSAVDHVLNGAALRGPVNVVAPQAVTNREFTRALGRALSRPTFFPMPAAAARLAFGAMADELLLSSARVVPERLTASGFHFAYPEIEGALRRALEG